MSACHHVEFTILGYTYIYTVTLYIDKFLQKTIGCERTQDTTSFALDTPKKANLT